MSIVRQYNKKTDTVYIYQSISYYRPDKKRCYYKRKLLGKEDPETGKLIPTGPKGKHSNHRAPESEMETLPIAPQGPKQSGDMIPAESIDSLKAQNASLREAYITLQAQINELRSILDAFLRNLQKAGVSMPDKPKLDD